MSDLPNGSAGGCFVAYAASGGINPLTCTLFDPGDIGGLGEKCRCSTSAQRAEIPTAWYIFPRRGLKPAHGPSRCVTGLREEGRNHLTAYGRNIRSVL